VFPDIEGYKVPPNAKRLPFTELLKDALQQLSHLPHSEPLAVKVTKGTVEVEHRSNDSIWPFITAAPANVTEAYDTFSLVPRLSPKKAAHPLDLQARPLNVVSEGITLLEVRFTREYYPKLLELWESTVDTSKQLLSCAPTSPCTASSRMLQTDEKMHWRAFASQFCESTIKKWVADDGSQFDVPHGVVNLETMTHVTEAEYEMYLTRFMICLLCGTTVKNGLEILDRAEFRLISTPQGKTLLALINRAWLNGFDQARSALLSRGMTDIEGLHVAVRSENDNAWVIVGRTWIPKD
jgi:hypothetical protein